METVYCSVFEEDVHKSLVPNYSEEEHGTWKLLLDRQKSLIHGRACDEFIAGLSRVSFPETHIPRLKDISDIIESHTGWRLIRVDGLVHPRDFFKLLAKKIFPSTDFIRKRSELDYTPAPDMFHDLFGHTPLLTDPEFTEFFEAFGKVGVNAFERFPDENHPIHQMLPRLYWFTVEFGLVQTLNGVRAYGSGSVSSPQELEYCVTDQCRKHPFKVDEVAERLYDIWHLQEDVFVIESFNDLGKQFRDFAARHKIL